MSSTTTDSIPSLVLRWLSWHGAKLFAVPWAALTLDTKNKRFVLNVDKDMLKDAPGFDEDNWPDMADASWTKKIHSYYGIES